MNGLQDRLPKSKTQGELSQCETGRNLAIQLPPVVLQRPTEDQLLRAYGQLLEAKSSVNIPANQLISSLVGKSISHVNQALSGATSIGDEGWRKLEIATGYFGHTLWQVMTSPLSLTDIKHALEGRR